MYSTKIRPYTGNEPYIFISYAHKDADIVLPILEHMSSDGYRIWYDEGIIPGNEWDDEIALHILQCDCFIAFISNNYLNSQNCRDELKFSRDEDKERLLIYVEDVTLPPGLAMRLNRLQALYVHRYEDSRRFYEKLYEADMLKKSKGIPLPTPVPVSPFTPPPGLSGTIPAAFSPISAKQTSSIPANHVTDPRYTLEKKIGGGGMATVYRAIDNRTNKIVAVKFYRNYAIQECPFFTDVTLCDTIAELNHPSFCKILDSDQIADPYLVTEYVDGITLDDYIRGNNTYIISNFYELLTAYQQILGALFQLHKRNIFYGDVSPTNVMLSKSKQAYLVDYTECNYIGSPNPQKTMVLYQSTSPERISGAFIDHRSDIYEVGALLEQMVQRYMNNSRIFLPKDAVDVYDTPIFDIVRKATKQNPEDRYQSILEMVDAIEQVMANI